MTSSLMYLEASLAVHFQGLSLPLYLDDQDGPPSERAVLQVDNVVKPSTKNFTIEESLVGILLFVQADETDLYKRSRYEAEVVDKFKEPIAVHRYGLDEASIGCLTLLSEITVRNMHRWQDLLVSDVSARFSFDGD